MVGLVTGAQRYFSASIAAVLILVNCVLGWFLWVLGPRGAADVAGVFSAGLAAVGLSASLWWWCHSQLGRRREPPAPVPMPAPASSDRPANQASFPAVVGRVPGVASAFQPRLLLREQVDSVRAVGGTVVLTGLGGRGKTQLAAWFADRGRIVLDLVVWVDARSEAKVIEGLALAAERVAIPGRRGEVRADAEAMLGWLASTDKTWLVVFDNIDDPQDVATWWPPSGARLGWTLATTRRVDASLAGGGRTMVPIGLFTEEESANYLNQRVGLRQGTDGAGALACALDHLPLALSHAASYLLDQDLNHAEYLAHFHAANTGLDAVLPADSDTDHYGRTIAATLLVGMDAVDRLSAPGLARAVLGVISVLDPAGHPPKLWETAAIEGFSTGRVAAESGAQVTKNKIREVLQLLHKYGLITVDRTSPELGVQIHVLTARAAREASADLAGPIQAAAAALDQLWLPENHVNWPLSRALTANTKTLMTHPGNNLWQAGLAPIIFKAGQALYDSGLYPEGRNFWEQVTKSATLTLGADHPDTLRAMGTLAIFYARVARFEEAAALREQVSVGMLRTLGPDHLDTVWAQIRLASSFARSGRVLEAVAAKERAVLDLSRLLGADHPDTVWARGTLAIAYSQAGRCDEAISLEEQVVADRERLLGSNHPDTVWARGNLAISYSRAGRVAEAMALRELVAGDMSRILGANHPDAVRSRGRLAISYAQSGRIQEAQALLGTAIADVSNNQENEPLYLGAWREVLKMLDEGRAGELSVDLAARAVD